MKKLLSISLAALMIPALLAGCSARSNSDSSYSSSSYSSGYSVAAEAAYDGDYYYEAAEEEAYYDDYWDSGSMSTSSSDTDVPSDYGDVKMIYTANMEMESTEFDDAVQAIAQLTASCGGYYESSSMSDRYSYRTAYFTVRVPAAQYRAFLNSAGELAHVTYQEESSVDVSETYYDTAGRLETQKTKLARLQELLAEAQHMDDIIVLENEISATEETIDRLSGTLRHYDALVSYSTVDIYLREVKNLTEVPVVTETFGSRLASAFRSGWNSFTEGIGAIILALARIWMWLIFIAVIVAVVLLLTKKRRAERKERKKNAPPVVVPEYARPKTGSPDEKKE